jgi:release factor glutamine methyltransferase
MSQTLQQLYQSTKDRLLSVTASPSQASLEAILLLEALLNTDAATIYSNSEKIIADAECRQVEWMLQQRLERRLPVQYLIHKAWFYGLSFYVNPAVLIPRPETELLVEKTLERIRPGMRVLDVGTGPGTIAITLAHQLGDAVAITAVDASHEALKVAKLNQRILKTHVIFREAGDLFAPIGSDTFDVIVSNPPYVDPRLKDTLAPEVLWHEPSCALFPPDGDAYYFYKRLADEGKAHLAANGGQADAYLLVEIGADMAEKVRVIFQEAGFQDVEIFNDYAGLPRVVSGVYKRKA